MSASSLLEQVQARPACLGHCVRREGARPGPGPSPPVGPSRGGASRGPGFGPLRPAAPCASPSARSSRFSPVLSAQRPRRLSSSAGLVFLPRSLPLPRSPGPVASPLARPPRFLGGLAGLALSPASRSPASPSATVPDADPEACSFLPLCGPALIRLLFSISPSDTLLLGDVSFARRDQKVKETKVSPAPAGGPEMGDAG